MFVKFFGVLGIGLPCMLLGALEPMMVSMSMGVGYAAVMWLTLAFSENSSHWQPEVLSVSGMQDFLVFPLELLDDPKSVLKINLLDSIPKNLSRSSTICWPSGLLWFLLSR